MIELQMWQIVSTIVLVFLFGFFTGRALGIQKAWSDMDKEKNADSQKDGNTL